MKKLHADNVIEVKNLSVKIGGNLILKNINLTISRGETVLITGPSGSGKTTFFRVLTGIIPHLINGNVYGTINILKYNPLNKNHVNKINKLITLVPQEPWDALATPYVWTELAISAALKADEINEYLSKFSMLDLRNRLTYTLSAGETQKLILISSLLTKPEIYLFDEPLSHLDFRNRGIIKDFIRYLKELNKTILIIDHDIKFWSNLIDKVLYVESGRLRTQTSYDIIKSYDNYLNKIVPPKNHRGNTKKTLCVVRNLYFSYSKGSYLIKGPNFDINEGDLIALIGPTGSGKTTLLKIIAGILKPKKGYVKCYCHKILIPENPILYLTEPTIFDEVIKHGGSLGKELLLKFSLWKYRERGIRWLSSGERRRLAIASAVARGFDLIMIDEPTVGLDPMNKVKVLNALSNVIEKGKAVIIASHDPIVRKVANKIIKLGDTV